MMLSSTSSRHMSWTRAMRLSTTYSKRSSIPPSDPTHSKTMRPKQWLCRALSDRKTLRAGRDILRLSPGTSTTFCNLPEDVLIYILSHCDLQDLLSCVLVSDLAV